VAQFIGAVIACFAVLLIVRDTSAKTGFLCTPDLAPNVTMLKGRLIEVVLPSSSYSSSS
jgi:hypothetical protein